MEMAWDTELTSWYSLFSREECAVSSNMGIIWSADSGTDVADLANGSSLI